MVLLLLFAQKTQITIKNYFIHVPFVSLENDGYRDSDERGYFSVFISEKKDPVIEDKSKMA